MSSKLSHYLLAFALCIINRVSGATNDRTVLAKFEHAPFPYHEPFNPQQPSFFDQLENGRRGHSSVRGGIYWEDITYSDNRVLLSLPPGFNLQQKPVILVYFHGNQSTLERDVRDRQQIPAQVANAGINALLVAPQFAVDALDSSPGHFTEEGFFSKFLQEVADQVSQWQGNKQYRDPLNNADVIIVAYSGGYQAAAYALERGGADHRIAGVILLDALYGQEKIFADWIQAHQHKGFFFSTYTEPARLNNENLQNLLTAHTLGFSQGIPETFTPGTVGFFSLGDDMAHYDLLSRAWAEQPLTDLLRRIKTASQLQSTASVKLQK